MEFADELADGAKGAALPAIQHSLVLGYGQIGLLASVPLLVGGLLELPVGLLRNRRLVMLTGGVFFVLALAGVAFAQNFAELLAAFVLFFPASGAFVSLTQASLMDADPGRRARLMARWDLAGSAGAVTGPVLLAAVIAVGGDWRGSYLALAALSALAWFGVLLGGATADPTAATEPAGTEPAATEPAGTEPGDDGPATVRDVLAGARTAARWLVLLEIANLLVDVLTGFAAVYLVDVVHTSPLVATLAIALRLGSALAGDALLVAALDRLDDRTVLRVTAVAAALLYPAFLLVSGVPAKLAVLAVLSAATATWYPLLQARLYDTVSSSVAVTLSSVAGMAGAAGPLAVGVAAGAFGLTWALAGLAVVPIALFIALPGNRATRE